MDMARLLAHVLGGDGGVDRIAGQRNVQRQVGIREPVAAEISGVNDACYGLPIRVVWVAGLPP